MPIRICRTCYYFVRSNESKDKCIYGARGNSFSKYVNESDKCHFNLDKWDDSPMTDYHGRATN